MFTPSTLFGFGKQVQPALNPWVPDAGDFLLFSGVYVTLMEHLLWAREWDVKMGVASFSK